MNWLVSMRSEPRWCGFEGQVDIGRSYTAMKKVIGEVAATHPADCVRRFCSALGLVNQDMKASAQQISCDRKLQV